MWSETLVLLQNRS